jgi:hypothetical protein
MLIQYRARSLLSIVRSDLRGRHRADASVYVGMWQVLGTPYREVTNYSCRTLYLEIILILIHLWYGGFSHGLFDLLIIRKDDATVYLLHAGLDFYLDLLLL